MADVYESFKWDEEPNIFIFNEYLPGRTKMHTKRLDLKNWVMIDNTYVDQMRMRAKVLLEHYEEVFVTNNRPETNTCKWELFDMLTSYLPQRFPDKFEMHSGYIRNKVLKRNISTQKDDPEDPLIRLSELTQEDWIIMEWDDVIEKYVLTAGILCFPSSWWLREKFNKHITQIHKPVKPFLDHLDNMVQSLLRKMKCENPVWRANWGIYNNLKNVLDLYAPPSDDIRISVFDKDKTGKELILREEYQTLRKLPITQCVVFSIRYYQRYIEEFEHLPLSDCIGLLNALEGLSDDMKSYKGVEVWGDALEAYLRYVINRRQKTFVGQLKSYAHAHSWMLSVLVTVGSLFVIKRVIDKCN